MNISDAYAIYSHALQLHSKSIYSETNWSDLCEWTRIDFLERSLKNLKDLAEDLENMK